MTQKVPRVSLLLDLQSQLKNFADSTQNDDLTIDDDDITTNDRPRTVRSETTLQRSNNNNEEQQQERIREILNELSICKDEREKLLDEKRKLELSLAEERARREFAETKLETARTKITEHEETLRQRQSSNDQGYLLVSPKSMEDICRSFASLLKILEETSLKKSNENNDDFDIEDSNNQIREDIERKFAFIIRKTKSENLKRGNYFADHQNNKKIVSRLKLMSSRYGKSESNITTTIEPLPQRPIRIERFIGDTIESNNRRLPQILDVNDRSRGNDDVLRLPTIRRQFGAGDETTSLPSDRARLLFASIVNGDALLNVDTLINRSR